MAARTKKLQLPLNLPEGLRRLFESFPVAQGASQKDYELLFQDIINGLQPRDTIEMLWARDVTDLVWEARQLRLVRARLLHVENAAASRPALLPPNMNDLSFHLNNPDLWKLTQNEVRERRRQWDRDIAAKDERQAKEDKAAQQRRKTIVREDPAALQKSYLQHSSELERLSRLIALADTRRDAVLRELERRRAMLGDRPRLVQDNIIDAECTEAPPPPLRKQRG